MNARHNMSIVPPEKSGPKPNKQFDICPLAPAT